MSRLLLSWVLPVLVVLGFGPGNAEAIAVVSTSVFDFTGVCSDCAGTGTAELTLSNYTLGTAITSSNFVSLHYDGSNLLAAFTINSSDLSSVNGMISAPFPEAENLTVFGDNFHTQFLTHASGAWCAGPNCASDRGNVSGWAPATAAAGPTGVVPEPMSVALMAGGLLAGFAVRRRRG